MGFRAVNEYLFHVSGFFYYFSATLNPILYNVMSIKYRQAFRSSLCCGPNTSPSSLARSYTWRSTVSKSMVSHLSPVQDMELAVPEVTLQDRRRLNSPDAQGDDDL